VSYLLQVLSPYSYAASHIPHGRTGNGWVGHPYMLCHKGRRIGSPSGAPHRVVQQVEPSRNQASLHLTTHTHTQTAARQIPRVGRACAQREVQAIIMELTCATTPYGTRPSIGSAPHVLGAVPRHERDPEP
jgi:hypothetical protein